MPHIDLISQIGVGILSGCFVVFGFALFFNSSYATRLSKEEFMNQYESGFITGFPTTITHRTVLTHWCQALLQTTTNSGSKPTPLSGFLYSNISISPRQSILAYMLCHGVNPKTYQSFDKSLVATISKPNYKDNIVDLDTKVCNFSDLNNDLNACNLVQRASDLTLLITNDLNNVRQATSWGYTSSDESDIGYLMAQYFSYATADTHDSLIQQLNTSLCNTPQIAYFQSSRSSQCGFPITYNSILSNRKNIGQPLLKNTTILNGNKLLGYTCNHPESGDNLLGCGINDHSSSQPYSSLMYNELRVYNQFLSMYQGVASVNRDFINQGQVGLSDSWYHNALNELLSNISKQRQLITQSINTSIDIITQLETNYPTHIGFLAAIEVAQKNTPQRTQRKTNSSNTIINRQNTQKPSTTKQG